MVPRKFCGLSEEGWIASRMGVGGTLEEELHEGGIEVDLGGHGSGISQGTEAGNTGYGSMYHNQYLAPVSTFSQCLVHRLYISLAGHKDFPVL